MSAYRGAIPVFQLSPVTFQLPSPRPPSIPCVHRSSLPALFPLSLPHNLITEMKNYLIYGTAQSVGLFLFTLILYIVGLHSDPAKVGMAGWIFLCGFFPICATCLFLGSKAQRDATPLTEDFGYGRALGAGVMITLVAAVLGVVFGYIYNQIINPHFMEVQTEARHIAMEAKNVPAAQIEQFDQMTEKFNTPVMQAVFGFAISMILGTIISLITSIFVKRAAVDELTSVPPLS